MRKHIIGYGTLGIVALVATLNGCSSDESTPTAAQETSRVAAPVTRTAAPVTLTTPPAPAPPRALTVAGTYKVGTEIQPGTYRYTVTRSGGGYWALCADVACRPGEGMIDNDFIPDAGATGYLDIGPGVAYVEHDDLVLTPA